MQDIAPLSPLVLPMQAWPAIDQRLWAMGLGPGDGLDPVYATRLAETTVANARKTYGRWLAVLAEAGILDRAAHPADRVTRANAKQFLRSLRACGNTNNSIRARLWALQSALAIMAPDVDVGWLTAKLNLLPITLRDLDVFDSARLEAWGHKMMHDALQHPRPMIRQTHYRNGLLIAILASRAPRLRSLAAMRLGRQVTQTSEGGWLLSFKVEDVKTRRPVEYPVPGGLIGCIDRYLSVERRELLQGREDDAFWINKDGRRLGIRGIEGLIRRASEEQFGTVFGPHRFRHALATTAAYADPSNPGLAASVLAVSEAVVEGHYNQARRADAFLRYQANLQAERQRVDGRRGRANP